MGNFDDLIAEFEQSDSEMMEQARKEAKEWSRKVLSGEIELDIKELYIDENGNLREME